jgi:pimeloyl-ACP methyl ester carboxylesterase
VAWGDGPRVLLVHGWGGDSTQLSELVRPLIEAGFRVMAYDLPAHGINPGRRTNVFEAADAISAIGREHGPLHTVVAHSFGTLASLVAIRHRLLVGRVVALAPTVMLDTMIAGFAELLTLSHPVRSRLAGRVLQFAGPDFWSDLSQSHPALIIHDDTDSLAPVANGEYLASVWPEARLSRTTGLGHYRLLRDPGVIAQLVDFTTAALPSPRELHVEDRDDVARVRGERSARHTAVSGHHDLRGASR